MDATELCFTPATALAAAVRARRLSPVEIVDAALARIESLNPRLSAFVTVDADGARAAARAAEAAVMRGAPVPPLHGLPVPIKDLDPVAGLRCTYGSRFYADHVAEVDSVVAERVKAAGGIVIGKTNTSHYGYRDTADNLIGPPCRNPWRLDRTSGGSSGGAASAVAAGLAAVAHGSDGAGSIRIPAAFCGVFGFKPSLGRVPFWPTPDIWAARAHNGPISRTVADAALLLGALAGPDARDPLSIDARPDDYLAAVQDPLPAVRELRVAWSADFGYAALDAEVRRLASAAAERFASLGAHVDAVDPGWSDPRDAARTIWHASYAARLTDRYRERADWIEPELATMIEAGRQISAVELGRAMFARTSFHAQAQAFFTRYDLLLTPQMPAGAWPVEGPPTSIGGTPTPGMFDRLPFTFPFNMTGQPAASVPCGFTSDGLPAALQIVGRWHADTLVLQAAAAFEQAAPWAGRRPSL
jgi:Asp-tRNA(Asn)/Glu-tRNA(Gln) amidotransferase A subunit family amidase